MSNLGWHLGTQDRDQGGINPIIYQNLSLVVSNTTSYNPGLSAVIKGRTYLRNLVIYQRNYLYWYYRPERKEYKSHIVIKRNFPQPGTLIIRNVCFLIPRVDLANNYEKKNVWIFVSLRSTYQNLSVVPSLHL